MTEPQLPPVMAIRQYPDPKLRDISRAVGVDRDGGDGLDPKMLELVRQISLAMRETMHDRKGIGLSAIQVGIPLRVFVMKTAAMRTALTFVNAEIIGHSKTTTEAFEGCLSFGGEGDIIERSDAVTVKRWDEHGRLDTHEFEGLEARVVQHELEHFRGVLFVDHLSQARRRMIHRRLTSKAVKRTNQLLSKPVPRIGPVISDPTLEPGYALRQLIGDEVPA